MKQYSNVAYIAASALFKSHKKSSFYLWSIFITL